jgi:transposase
VVRLKATERRQIETMLRGGVEAVRAIKLAQVLRLLDQGMAVPQVAGAVGLSGQAVRDIGWRYAEAGLERALFEKPRPGQAPGLDPGQAQRIVAMICDPPPPGQARWSVRLIAATAMQRHLVAHVGRETIRMLLKHHDLKPWREKMWCVGWIDAAYRTRMEAVPATDEQPLTPAAPVLCLDERPVALRADTRPSRSIRPA